MTAAPAGPAPPARAVAAARAAAPSAAAAVIRRVRHWGAGGCCLVPAVAAACRLVVMIGPSLITRSALSSPLSVISLVLFQRRIPCLRGGLFPVLWTRLFRPGYFGPSFLSRPGLPARALRPPPHLRPDPPAA